MTRPAVLLDVLGTLVRLEDPAPALRAELAARGIEVSQREAAVAIGAEIAYYLAHHLDGATPAGLEELRDRCAREVLRTLALPADRLAPVREAMLAALVFTPFDDVLSTLQALRAAGHRLVAASNWDCSLSVALERAGLAGLLDGAVSSAVAGAAKPDPAVFRAALELAGAEPREAVFVGDSLDNDVRGAQECGVRAILLARDGAPPSGVETIESLAALPSLISSG